MAGANQWTVVNPGDAPAAEVLAQALSARLQQVRRSWRKARRHPEESSADAVHQMRVAIRRTLAAVRVYEDLLPARPCRKFKKQLRRIRRGAGPVRDLDVALTRLHRWELPPDVQPAREWFVEDLRSRRAAAWQDLHALGGKRLLRKLRRRTRKLLKGLAASDHDGGLRYAPDALARLQRIVVEFLACAQAERRELADYHILRIAGKRLRYSLELLAGAVCPDLVKHLLELLGEMQEYLGRLNDAAIALEQNAEWAPAAPEATQPLWAWLTAHHENELRMTRERFTQWWTGERGNNLRRSLEPLAGSRHVA